MRYFMLLVIAITPPLSALSVSGIVFYDKNENTTQDEGEPGIPGVLLSNGIDIVVTNDDGTYSIDWNHLGVVFLIKPSGWHLVQGTGGKRTAFYHLYRAQGTDHFKYSGLPPTGSPAEQINLPLKPTPETGEVKLLILGDTQTRNIEETQYLARDLLPEFLQNNVHAGITLGDNVFDDLSVFVPLRQALEKSGIPWHYVPGNHDMDYDAPQWQQAFETFQNHLGPAYYAATIGNVHILILNNIRLHTGTEDYHAELGNEQLEFVKNFMAYIPDDGFLVVTMHIPIMELKDKTALFDLLAKHPQGISLSAHWHRHQHYFLNRSDGWPLEQEHHHIVHGTACGSWYRGFPDAVGIPEAVMVDGTPKGYSILTIDGKTYTLDYRASRRPAEYKMDIYIPAAMDTTGTKNSFIIANFFNGSEKCKLEMRINNIPWVPMQQFVGMAPFYMELYERQNEFVKRVADGKGISDLDDKMARMIETQFRPAIGRGMPKPEETNHLWKAQITDALQGFNVVEVRAHDMFGNTHSARSYFYCK